MEIFKQDVNRYRFCSTDVPTAFKISGQLTKIYLSTILVF